MKKTALIAGVFFLGGLAFTATAMLANNYLRPHKPHSVATAPANAALSDPRWSQLTSELETRAKRVPGRVAIYLKDLNTGRTWSQHPDELMPSASLIKVPIMAAVMAQVSQGKLSLTNELTITKKSRASGSGSLKWYRTGTKFTVATLLYHLITESDNTAMRVLVNHLGLGYFQKAFAHMGLLATNIEEDGLKLSSRPVLKENYTTAREMADLLEQIYRGALIDKEASQIMLELMKSLKHRERLAKTLPPGWAIAHKTGLLRRACHDAGIVFSPTGDYVLVVMTWKGGDYKGMKRHISQIGNVTYRYYGGQSDLATTTHPPSYVRGI
ncbi:MAG: serine hydrolase [Elusimicrobia bacterium]|nr:serine hydrolase [Elusimicrobiota bacterium]